MAQLPDPTLQPPPRPDEQSGGVNVSGGAVRAGRDIAGRDIVSGFSADAVVKIVIAVGLLVFTTAFCFFSGGVVVGAAALGALARPVGSSQAEALSMLNKLDQINALRPGQRFALTFSEDELSSYVRFITAPQLGLNDGKVRFLEPGRMIVAGDWRQLNNLPVAATFRLGQGERPLQLESAVAQVLPTGNSTFGWVAVPNALVEPTVGQIEERLFANVRIDSVIRANPPPGAQNAWTVTGIRK